MLRTVKNKKEQKDMYEYIKPKTGLCPILIHLPFSDKKNDLIFGHRMWGMSFIRPSFKNKQCNLELNYKELTNYQVSKFQKPYYNQIHKILTKLHKNFGKSILLDISISSKIKHDLILDASETTSKDMLEPILSTLKITKIDFIEKKNRRRRNIISSFANTSERRFAIKIIFSTKMFVSDKDEPMRLLKGLRVFEQIVSLALEFS